MNGRIGRVIAVVVVAVISIGGAATANASATHHAAAAVDCSPHLLVLSAEPEELAPLLARTDPRGGKPLAVGSHTFYTGTLGGHRAVLTLVGTGPVNARNTTRLALSHFQCDGRTTITGIVFSGVAGGDYIGDVNAATRWTEDGKHFIPVSRAMLRVARAVQRAHRYRLSRDNHAGDPLCIHLDPETGPAVTVTHTPTFKVGGNGLTTDPFGGRALPCFPGGGDVFGCRPCESANVTPTNPVTFFQQIAPFLNPDFFTGYFSSTAAPPGHYVSSDEETAEVAKAARAAHVPFIGFRGVSDGGGDPLHLPGFPFQFFVYRQLSADNVGAVAAAFIQAWHDPSDLSAEG
ncbi:MAG: 5'-methylthioadenosine/S-adenosylhomocysteine nucleosidase family protein [Mycobacteriales bacterium]